MIQNAKLRKGEFCLKKLVWHARYFLMAGVLGAVTFIVTIFLKPSNWKLTAAFALVITLITVLLFVKAKKDISSARLIIENQILHIQPAVFQDLGEEKATDLLSGEAIEVFVSGFGILLDSKIIKFNQDGIQLKAVELGRHFISLTYGTKGRIHNIKLLHWEFSDDMLAEISQKFRYETGVVPLITY